MARLDKHALLRRSAGVMTIVVASVLGTVATAVAWRNEQRGVTERDRRLTDSASGTFAAQLISTIESLRGVSGLAADGSVSDIEFKAFSSEVLPGSLIEIGRAHV